MKSNIQIFKNEVFGEIRTCQVNNQIMFVGKDVATALGYANTRKAVLDHVDKEDREDGVTIRDAIVGCTLRMLNEPAEDTLTATQVAKTFNMTVFDFNHVLSDMGIQYRRGGHWNISDDLADRDLVRLRTHVSYSLKGEKKVKVYMTWTMNGLRFLNSKLGYPNF